MNAVVDAPQAELFIPVARIYGTAMEHLPQDLYIPPDALEIMLDAFEGPLDLLLYLIRKANVDILDIPMAPLTRQYLDYIDSMQASNLELAAAEREFYWVETLVEKSLYVRHPDVSVADLKEAWDSIFRQAKLNKNHKIGREELSVREHMGIILRLLQERGGFVQFETMFDPEMGAPGLVVHFLAMLELAREKLVEFTQTEAFQPIYVRVHQGGSEPSQESA